MGVAEVLAGRRRNKSVTAPHIVLVIRSTAVSILYEIDQTQ